MTLADHPPKIRRARLEEKSVTFPHRKRPLRRSAARFTLHPERYYQLLLGQRDAFRKVASCQIASLDVRSLGLCSGEALRCRALSDKWLRFWERNLFDMMDCQSEYILTIKTSSRRNSLCVLSDVTPRDRHRSGRRAMFRARPPVKTIWIRSKRLAGNGDHRAPYSKRAKTAWFAMISADFDSQNGETTWQPAASSYGDKGLPSEQICSPSGNSFRLPDPKSLARPKK